MEKVTFKMLEEVFEKAGYKIEKGDKTYHYSVKIKNNTYHIYYKGMAKMFEEINNIGVVEFISKNDYEKVVVEKQRTKELALAQKKAEKEAKKSSKTKVNSLEEELVAITLKIMSLVNRGTEEHMVLRDRLHEIYNELVELGLREPIGRKKITEDEISEAVAKGTRKRKVAKEKKEIVKNTRTTRSKKTKEEVE